MSTSDLPSLSTTVLPVTLKFEEVIYKVKVGCKDGSRWWGSSGGGEKTILKGISGMVGPGELLALLGPSGSGKTTLLTALSGRALSGSVSGKVTGAVKRRTGFVAQNDVLYPHLTVWESLLFTALLRLPATVDREAQVEAVVAQLGLGRCRDSVVGGPMVRGISGGEKKRVSIGQEMLVNPSLLLVDEPTSGLDSTAARRIVGVLKSLAAGGRTVVSTIHQPSTRVYHMFDKVLVLSEGRAIFYGAPGAAGDHFGRIGLWSPGVNPAEVMLDLANGVGPAEEGGVQEAVAREYEGRIKGLVMRELEGEKEKEACGSEHHQGNDEMAVGWWEQVRVLGRRGMKERRHESFNGLRVGQVMSVAVLGGMLWWKTPEGHIEDRVALLFFFSVFWGFYPLYNAVFTFPGERAMLGKEQASGMYRLSAYFVAKTAADLPLDLALPTAFVCVVYWMGGLDPHPRRFLLSLLVVLYSVLVSQSLGLAIGALLMDVKRATTVASVTTLVFLMAGGYYVQHIPPFILWLKYLSYSYYCYKLLLGVHYTGPDSDTYPCHSPTARCRVADFPPIASMGTLHHLWLDVSIMFLMLLVYRLLAYLALHRLARSTFT